ncbi:MAG: hypothetical protein P8X95_28740 [Anaerolineales bacterium]
MNEPAETIGLLLMAYGSPDSLEDMEAYLLDIRGGRPTPQSLVEAGALRCWTSRESKLQGWRQLSTTDMGALA